MFAQSSNVCTEFQCLHRVPMFAQSSDVCCTCRVIFHMFHSISPSNISYPLILPSSLQVLFTHRFSDIHHWNDSDNILQIVCEFIIVDFSWVVLYMCTTVWYLSQVVLIGFPNFGFIIGPSSYGIFKLWIIYDLKIIAILSHALKMPVRAAYITVLLQLSKTGACLPG